MGSILLKLIQQKPAGNFSRDVSAAELLGFCFKDWKDTAQGRYRVLSTVSSGAFVAPEPYSLVHLLQMDPPCWSGRWICFSFHQDAVVGWIFSTLFAFIFGSHQQVIICRLTNLSGESIYKIVICSLDSEGSVDSTSSIHLLSPSHPLSRRNTLRTTHTKYFANSSRVRLRRSACCSRGGEESWPYN